MLYPVEDAVTGILKSVAVNAVVVFVPLLSYEISNV
jgi:hypothetical protein